MKDLHVAARWADAGRVSELLRSGADPNEYDEHGYTPLLWVAFMAPATGAGFTAPVGDQAAAIRALVDAGADVNAINAMGDSTALMLAAQAENPVVIRALVESGALVDLAADDVTPLMVAAKTGCFETTRLLLELGADPRICAGRFAAADYARSRGHEELAELLEVACSQRGG